VGVGTVVIVGTDRAAMLLPVSVSAVPVLLEATYNTGIQATPMSSSETQTLFGYYIKL